MRIEFITATDIYIFSALTGSFILKCNKKFFSLAILSHIFAFGIKKKTAQNKEKEKKIIVMKGHM